MPIFCQKNVHFLKNTVLLCRFFQIFHEKPATAMPIFGQKKSQFCQNNIILAINVNRMPFFSLQFLLKKSLLLCPYFVNKTPNI